MMTDEAGFLGRWSRRKEEARRAGPMPGADAAGAPPPATDPVPEEARAPGEGARDGTAGGAERLADGSDGSDAAFDPASLPPIDSLGAGSDYTAFLRPQVPKALRAAALRRAWVSQPAITGFKSLADYDWDVNAPGYGRLWPTDDPGKFVEALFRHLREEPAPLAPDEAAVAEAPPEGGDPVGGADGGPEAPGPPSANPAAPGGMPPMAAATGPEAAPAPGIAAGPEGIMEPAAAAAAAGSPTGPPPPASLSPAASAPAASPARPPGRRHGGARPA